MLRMYLAGSIFTYADQLRNTEWAKKIREAIPDVDLYSPIENTEINRLEGKKKFAGSKEIADADNARLDNTDILVACIDSWDIHGTCAEIGRMSEKIARGEKKYVVGILTDNRTMYRTFSEEKVAGGKAALGEQQWAYTNLYVVGLIKQSGVLVDSIEDAIEFIKSKEKEFD